VNSLGRFSLLVFALLVAGMSLGLLLRAV